MKVTNFEIINMVNALEGFSEKKLPQKISYAITRNITLLLGDYECYAKSLEKLFAEYDDHIKKDKDGNPMRGENGMPIVDDCVKKEFDEEIANLLSIEIEAKLHHIPESTFDYEDDTNRYDSLSAADIMLLQNILCDKEVPKRETSD